MTTAKIIRHRHKHLHYMNDDLKEVKEITYFKIVFSDPIEFERWKKWCTDNGGEYDYDKENSCQRGKLLPRYSNSREKYIPFYIS